MWDIFRTYYCDVTRQQFLSDLSQKRHIILVRDKLDNSLQGFSTLEVFRERVDGRYVTAIFSGDTIIEKAYWGQTTLQKAFFRYILKVKLTHPRDAVYWFLISKGYKTYLLLARNFPEHWPRHDKKTPRWQQAVLDTLARKKFGEFWIPELGILRFNTPQGRLREKVAEVSNDLLTHPDIRFFHQQNPGHAEGEELCCIGRVDTTLAIFYPLKLAAKLLKKRIPLRRNRSL
jgi:hypothetical protein